MNKIAWSKDLTVGVAEIDEQHRQWIQRLNDVASAIAAHQGPVQLGQTLAFLVDYTQQHFATEEKLMAAAKYPGLKTQLAQHQELTETLKDLVRENYGDAIQLNIHTDSIYMGALGAAMFALDDWRAGKPSLMPQVESVGARSRGAAVTFDASCA